MRVKVLQGRIRHHYMQLITAVSISALMALGAVVIPRMALADPPSESDIASARSAESAAKLSVAQIETELASVRDQAYQAEHAAKAAGEDLNGSRVVLKQATDVANQAKKEADEALGQYEKERLKLASVAQTVYRSGGSGLDALAPYLQSDGLRTVEVKQGTIDSFSSNADVQMQKVSALKEVAKVMSEAAKKAQGEKQKATDVVAARERTTHEASDRAQNVRKQTENRRTELVAELARKTNTTVKLVNEREAFLERQRQEAERKRAEAEAARVARENEQARQEELRRQEIARQQGADSAPAPARQDTPVPAAPARGSTGNGSAAAGAVAWALQQQGWPYVWGGEGPSDGGYDCSGLVMMAYRQQGIYLTHYSRAQYGEGTQIPLADRQPGDLVFWHGGGDIDHVAMYIGDDQIVEAPMPGMQVRVTAMYSWGSMMPFVVRL